MGIAEVAINKAVEQALQSLANRITALEAAPWMGAEDMLTLDKAAALIAEFELLAGAQVPAPTDDPVTVPAILE